MDQYLRTSHPDIYAAGDVAEFPDHTLGGRRRVEHEDNANTMGRLAGRRFAPEQPLWGTLVGIRRGGSHLFLRYAFGSAA